MKRLLIILSLFLLWNGSSLAQSSDWQGIDKTQVRLVTATTALGKGEDLLLGLHFKMQKNWKVYWRSPGDAGYPPELDWSKSTNLQSVEMLWPRPERFEVLGLETLGYKEEVVYPLLLKVDDPTKPLDLHAHLRFLTCADICVPVEADLALTLDPGEAVPSDTAQLINKFKSDVPRTDHQDKVSLDSADLHLKADQKNATLRVKLATDWALEKPDVLMEGPIELVFFKPSIALSDDRTAALIDIPLDGLQFLETPLADQTFTLTLMDGLHAYEVKTKVTPQTGPLGPVDGFSLPDDSPSAAPVSLWTIMALAVLGGLILNLMPCVLPVLSLKILGLVSHGGAATATVRLSFLASAAGILFSFLVLAGGLIALKASGAAIGWGIQFQQPLFLIALLMVLIMFAANMWGFFEIGLPGWMSSLGARSHSKGIGGHFATGAFATLLATPCSAPFLGTAVGFALSQGPTEIIAVFSALGVGLALPYLLIALFPGVATRLPRPGPWMVTLRKVLALALIATAVWLLSVLLAQIDPVGVGVLAGLLAAILLAFALKKHLRPLATPLVLALIVAAFFVPQTFERQATNDTIKAETLWVAFSTREIDELVKNGRTVFVDVTADWCITCQVNKKLVVYQGETFDLLQEDDIVAMSADWTNPDAEISAFLARYKKFAIPFNIVYGPGAPEGIILPELLDQKAVVNAITKARG